MSITKRLGIDVPILLAPMGGAVGPELCAAVSEAGGLGLIPLWGETHDVSGDIARVRGLTSRRFGVNLNNNYNQDRQLGETLDAGVDVVSFFWGLDAGHVRRARDAGAVVLQTASSAADARRAADAGVDAIVAQGWEAGGHVGGTVATLALVPAVVDAVPGVPVIAAGGIADGRGLAAVMALGAEAGWIGTRFLLADEATVSAESRAALVAASEADTQFGRDDTPTWYDSAIRWLGHQREPWAPEIGPRPRQLAGQGVGLVRRQQPAAAIVAEIWAEARETAAALAGRIGR
jgi:nitronate monooxygenase